MGHLWRGLKFFTELFFLFMITVDVATGEECQHRTPCTCWTSNFVLDLSPVMKNRPSLHVFDPTENYNYYVNPCDKEVNECKPSGNEIVACQVTADQKQVFGLGEKGKFHATGDPEKGTVRFTNSFTQGDIRILDMAIKCSDAEADFTFHNSTKPPAPEFTYYFTLSTKYACPPGPKSSSGLSVGSVLVILFFVFIIVYLIGGVVFLKFVRRAEGREAIPNYEFWKELPLLVKDGVVFTCRGCKSETTYEKI